MSGAVVVDPSLSVAWVVEEDQTEMALHCLRDWQARHAQCIAPSLFATECAPALLKCVRRGLFSTASGNLALLELLAVVRVTPLDAQLAPRAYAIAGHLQLSKAYDSLYAALAEREGCDYWTGDRRFYQTARQHFDWIHWAGECRT